MENRIVINICGEDYALLADEAPSYMQKVGKYVDEKMSETLRAAKVNRTDAAVLTALNLADELMKSQQNAENLRSQLKGYLELLLRRFGCDIYSLQTDAAPADLFSEGLSYSLPGSNMPLAVMGTISPARLKQFGIKQPVFAAEINWPTLFTLIKRNKIRYSELPKFPEVRRDLALLLDESVSYADLRKSAFRAGKKLLKQVSLFDVYRGDKIAEGKKQYALSFVLQDLEKTLTDNDVERVMSKLLSTFQNEFGASLR